eukprot:Clim_evm6s38 gene=Clim_evmTU6s38
MKFLTTFAHITAAVQTIAGATVQVPGVDAFSQSEAVASENQWCWHKAVRGSCIRTDCVEDCPELEWDWGLSFYNKNFIKWGTFSYTSAEGNSTQACDANSFEGDFVYQYYDDLHTGFKVTHEMLAHDEDWNQVDFILDHIDQHVTPPYTQEDFGKVLSWYAYTASDERSGFPVVCYVNINTFCYDK